MTRDGLERDGDGSNDRDEKPTEAGTTVQKQNEVMKTF